MKQGKEAGSMHLRFRFWSIVALGLCVARGTPAPAMAQAAAVTTGPTLQETLDFLRELYKRQKPLGVQYEPRQGFLYQTVTSVQQLKPCQVTFLTLNRDTSPETDWVQRSTLNLQSSDPLSVIAEPYSKGSPGEFSVLVKNAVQATDWVAPEPNLNIAIRDFSFAVGANDGFVLAVAPQAITLLDVSRTQSLLSTNALEKSRVQRNGQPAGPHSPMAGDSFHYEKVKAKAPATFEFFSAPSAEPAERFSDFHMPLVADQDTASRVAKALIHAMVLCHKDERPSPF